MAESYEMLMDRKLDMISDKRDKRQGSLIYDALAPNAAETASFYADLDLLENRTFADTATGDDLTRRAAERGNPPLRIPRSLIPERIRLSGCVQK